MRARYEPERRWSKATAMWRGRTRSIRSPRKRAKPNTACTGLPSRSRMSGSSEWWARMMETGASTRKINSGQPALDAVVQRARAREVCQQVFHLIREHAPALEEDVLRVCPGEGHGDQLHLRLLGRARGFLIVAAAAGRHHVHPVVGAALAEGADVIARQLARREAHAAVHADVGIAPEQRLVVERRHIVVARVAGIAGVAHGRNDGVDFEPGAPPGAGIDAA